MLGERGVDHGPAPLGQGDQEAAPVVRVEPALDQPGLLEAVQSGHAGAADQAEVLEVGGSTIRLLADCAGTDGAISANRTVLQPGADGPPPHYHAGSAEIFFVPDGALQALAGDRVLTLDTGDFLVVPRNMPHAFAAPSGTQADVLIVFAPGASERFGYFRLGERVLRGQASPQEILDSQDRFDNHFMASPVWQAARAREAGQPS